MLTNDISPFAGSTPLNLKRTFEIRQGWELKEDDELHQWKNSFIVGNLKVERSSPEGCDSEPPSKRSSKRSVDHSKSIESKIEDDSREDKNESTEKLVKLIMVNGTGIGDALKNIPLAEPEVMV